MNINKKCLKPLGTIPVALFILSSCIPIFHSRTAIVFRNCTDDTLFICASHYNSINSIEYIAEPWFDKSDSSELDTIKIFLWNTDIDISNSFVYPDSLCAIDMSEYQYRDNDTWYFFLVRRADVKRYPWDEIHKKELYHKWITIIKTRDEYDRDIKY